MKPGEIITAPGTLTLNAGRDTLTLTVPMLVGGRAIDVYSVVLVSQE